jgi:hypothetical protein
MPSYLERVEASQAKTKKICAWFADYGYPVEYIPPVRLPNGELDPYYRDAGDIKLWLDGGELAYIEVKGLSRPFSDVIWPPSFRHRETGQRHIFCNRSNIIDGGKLAYLYASVDCTMTWVVIVCRASRSAWYRYTEDRPEGREYYACPMIYAAIKRIGHEDPGV